MKKLASIKNKGYAISLIAVLLILWEASVRFGWVSPYLLPSPLDVCRVFLTDTALLAHHSKATLIEAFVGLGVGLFLGFTCALSMFAFRPVYHALYPLLVLTQTIPTVAIAPLLVLWLGYGLAPKVVLIVIVTFFPVAITVYEGFRACDPDSIRLLRSMGASSLDILRYVLLPGALPNFFASLRIAISYAIVGAVIAEWLGGFEGLGVYMTRVKSAYAFDKMFAVIF